jgi:phage gp29-like protein
MEERDAHLYAEMGKRKPRHPLISTGRSSRRATPPPRRRRDAEWLTEVLTDAADPFEELLVGADGWHRPRLCAGRTGMAEANGGELLPAFHPRPQEWFRLDTSRREMRLRDASADGAPLQPFGWVLHTYGKAKTGYLGRMGLHRVLVWPFLYKAYAIGDFAEFLETFGLPLDHRQVLRRRHRRREGQPAACRHRAGPRRPRHHARRDGAGDPVHQRLHAGLAAPGDGRLGRAQPVEGDPRPDHERRGQVDRHRQGNADLHDEVRHDILKADTRQVEGTITRDLLYPLIALNRGGIDSLAAARAWSSIPARPRTSPATPRACPSSWRPA